MGSCETQTRNGQRMCCKLNKQLVCSPPMAVTNFLTGSIEGLLMEKLCLHNACPDSAEQTSGHLDDIFSP